MKKYIVRLTKDERESLKQIVNKGRAAAKKIMRARILLKTDQGVFGENWKDTDINKAVGASIITIENTRKQCVSDGLEAAISRKKPSRTRTIIIDGDAEAHLTALACGKAPDGRARWTLRLLAERMVELKYIDSISHEGVRQTLKKTKLSLG